VFPGPHSRAWNQHSGGVRPQRLQGCVRLLSHHASFSTLCMCCKCAHVVFVHVWAVPVHKDVHIVWLGLCIYTRTEVCAGMVHIHAHVNMHVCVWVCAPPKANPETKTQLQGVYWN
jgi:hypothetical protein